MAARHWTSTQRAQQSRLIQNWKPWNNSTGPRSTVGKVIVSTNPFKGGTRPMLREMAALLREQKQQLKQFD
jgi:hypothetical protein